MVDRITSDAGPVLQAGFFTGPSSALNILNFDNWRDHFFRTAAVTVGYVVAAGFIVRGIFRPRVSSRHGFRVIEMRSAPVTRRQLTTDMSVPEMIEIIAEGNRGAETVLNRLWRRNSDLISILDLDDMNLRGPRLWAAFKDGCGQNLDTLVAKIGARDPELVATVNRICGGVREIDRAVVRGRSYLVR